MEIKDLPVWSHSRINCLLSNPAEYYLIYNQGISPKESKMALSLGSAVHYALEVGTTDLTEYYQEKGNFNQSVEYSDEQALAEAMAGAYFRVKDSFYDKILTDEETGEKLEIIDEQHELRLTTTFKSKFLQIEHKFLGIIDLLLLTEKGWILIDYKTSSRTPEWEHYIAQLYTYDILLNSNFSDIPLYKVAIINLKKASIRKKIKETNELFKKRLLDAYVADDSLMDLHIYNQSEFKSEEREKYKQDLIGKLDMGTMALLNDNYFINYSNITGMYGTSQYADIFYQSEDNYTEYKIRDDLYDEETNSFVKERNCIALDMLVLKHDNICNHYKIFKSHIEKHPDLLDNKDTLFNSLQKDYICDLNLLDKYYLTYLKEKN